MMIKTTLASAGLFTPRYAPVFGAAGQKGSPNSACLIIAEGATRVLIFFGLLWGLVIAASASGGAG